MTEQTLPAPLERLRLREALQDRWRDQVRRITELSIALHTALADQDAGTTDPAAVTSALTEARLRLGQIEDAMHRLDDRTYGRCVACLVPIPLPALLEEPDVRCCAECRRGDS